MKKDDIQSLRALNFSWTKISRILGVSRQTLYRRLEEYGISCSDYTTMSSNDLDKLIKDIKSHHPNNGEVMMQGHLVGLGIRIPRSQLRASIHRVDHENTQLRLSHVVKRRQYSVEFPNSMWHIDGHHKLIRWKFVVHGAIDGFSRTIPYIGCSTNNCASTVLNLFLNGVSRFGLPDKVRPDHGGENIDVWRYMLTSHNNNPDCVLAGSSIHNERIERLWRDVHRAVLHFADTFCDLESDGILDTLNDVDMFCLHYVFLPRLNKCLRDFQESWNNHGLSTEGNMTPYQLFAEGMGYAAQMNVSTSLSILHASNTQNAAVNLPDTDEHVVVPRVSLVPCQGLLHQLEQSINPLQSCNDYGKGLYIQTVHIIGHHLLPGCDECFI